MLNINDYINSTEEIKIKDLTVNVYDLDTLLFNECLETTEGMAPQEIFLKQADLVLRMLNRNTQNHKFKKEDILKLPIKAIDTILITMIKRAKKAVIDPN